MRILILHMRYSPDPTGTGPLVTELATDLAGMGDEVVVVTSAPHYGRARVAPPYRGRLFHQAHEEGVKVLRTLAFDRMQSTVLGRAIDYVIYGFLSAAGALGGGPFDVILCVAPPITVGVSGWLAGLARKAPVVFNAQDVWPDGLISMGKLRSRLLISAFRALERFVYRRASRIVVVSDGMKANLLAKSVPADRVEVIPNWVDVNAIRPLARSNRFRISQGIEDHFVVLFAGNLGYAAGLETVVEAARMLVGVPRIAFFIVGEGSAKRDLVGRAQALGLSNMRFVTTQSKEILPDVFASADVSLVTLRKDMGSVSVPSKAYAIMASGRAMLAAVPANSEVCRLVTEAGCGRWVPPEDPEAMAEALVELSEQPEQLESFGRSGRSYAVAHCSRSAATARYRALLSEVAGLA